MNIRRIEVHDLLKVLTCNLSNLPENYSMQFWAYTILSWPDISFLAEDEGGKVVGYVLSSIEPAGAEPHTHVGYINSLSVLRPYRRRGLAQKLMDLTKDAMMREDATISYLQLHVRKSNKVAQSLYNKLGYKYNRVEEGYYVDGEDALVMQFPIRSEDTPQQKERSSSPAKKKAYFTNLWNVTHDILWRLLGATTALLRKKHSP